MKFFDFKEVFNLLMVIFIVGTALLLFLPLKILTLGAFQINSFFEAKIRPAIESLEKKLFK